MAGKSIKKVLILRTDYYGAIREGGTVAISLGPVHSLLKKGIDCYFQSCGINYFPPSCKYFFVKHNKSLLNLPEIYNLPYTHNAAKQASKAIKDYNIDLLFQFHSIMNYSGTLIKRKTNIPFVLHVDGVEYWAKQNWGRKLFLKKHLKWAELIQWNAADIIDVPSIKVKEMIEQYSSIDMQKVLVNPNGVDSDRFHPNINSLELKRKLSLENKFIIGFFGTFGHWHGVDVLAQSIEILKDYIKNFIVLFVGDGVMRPKVEEIVNTHNLKNYSMLTGMVNYSSIPQYMSLCDILVSPCINNPDFDLFNSPAKLFEYMAMGKPIVATNVGQQAEVIIDGYNGILCEERSPEALAEAIIKLYENPELREKCAINARKDAVEKHSWDNHTQRILDAVEKLL